MTGVKGRMGPGAPAMLPGCLRSEKPSCRRVEAVAKPASCERQALANHSADTLGRCLRPQHTSDSCSWRVSSEMRDFKAHPYKLVQR